MASMDRDRFTFWAPFSCSVPNSGRISRENLYLSAAPQRNDQPDRTQPELLAAGKPRPHHPANNRLGAALRLDLPSSPDHAQIYARRVASHLGSDADATASVFAIFTDAPWEAEQREFFPPLMHELAQQLAEFGMPIRAGWIVGPSSFAEY